MYLLVIYIYIYIYITYVSISDASYATVLVRFLELLCSDQPAAAILIVPHFLFLGGSSFCSQFTQAMYGGFLK